ncbi:MAG: endolytic transglycosylase MltG [Actinobacteria bacterium]|nr:endolytic transglycosylase MltG [Actinomycetota bacterium]
MALSTGSKVFALVMLSIMGGILYVLLQAGDGNAQGGAGDVITVEIPEGAAADQVGDILIDAGVVDNALSFQVKVRTDARAQQIQPGTYDLRAGMSNDEILDRLTETAEPIEVFSVTIPEGLTVAQTLERIADADNSPFKVKQLRKALAGVALPSWVPAKLPKDAEPFEGLLAPNTYEFRADINAQELLNLLVTETDANLRALDIDTDEYYRTLTIASLIEREVRVREEQPIVSSVIANRLDDDQRLQIDATVLYAKGEAGTRVLTSDTDIESPWNTYEVAGLPPTPIAAPGQSALEAAANPADTDFLYYVVCDFDTGEHAFSASFEQQQRNAARYREIRDAQSGSYCDEAA